MGTTIPVPVPMMVVPVPTIAEDGNMPAVVEAALESSDEVEPCAASVDVESVASEDAELDPSSADSALADAGSVVPVASVEAGSVGETLSAVTDPVGATMTGVTRAEVEVISLSSVGEGVGSVSLIPVLDGCASIVESRPMVMLVNTGEVASTSVAESASVVDGGTVKNGGPTVGAGVGVEELPLAKRTSGRWNCASRLGYAGAAATVKGVPTRRGTMDSAAAQVNDNDFMMCDVRGLVVVVSPSQGAGQLISTAPLMVG